MDIFTVETLVTSGVVVIICSLTLIITVASVCFSGFLICEAIGYLRERRRKERARRYSNYYGD
jgi:hypothetical protein